MEMSSDNCVTVEQLHEKEVINICDGKRLGYPCDIKFDLCTGCVSALILPGCGGFLSRHPKDGNIVIPLCNIEKIGKDIILVKCESFIESEPEEPKKKKRFFA